MTVYEHWPTVRFFEVDQQRVVYHMWYHAYFEDGRNELLVLLGASLSEIQRQGLDLQVVAFELEWLGPVRWGDQLCIGVEITKVGGSSLGIRYSASVGGDCRVKGEATYVLVSGTTARATPWPADLRESLASGGAQ